MSEEKKCPVIDGWDPYDPEFRADPFPVYRRMRSQCPVERSPLYGGFWAISRYDDVMAVARDPETFSSADGVAIPPFPFEGRALPMESDDPEHEEFRRILMPEFNPASMRRREPMVRESARRLIAGFSQKGTADFSEDYAKVLPTAVICQLLDIDELGGDFQDWAETIIYDRKDPQAGAEAAENIFNYFRELIPRRRANRGDDFISILMNAEVQGRPLDDRTILDFCWFLLIAGLDNTAFTIRNVLLQVSRMPGLREQLTEHPERIAWVTEEILRLYSPVWGIARTATRDTRLGGREIKKGDRIMMLYASADRDEREFDSPDEFVLGRPNNRHVAFGTGRHRCLGAPLARLEIRVAVEEIFAALPDYEIEGEVSWNEMGPLPARFTPPNS